MLDNIQYSSHLKVDAHFDYTVLIPTWNNLEYLKLCVHSLEKNSNLNCQIIVIINEGSDGTLEWVRCKSNIDYIYSPVNLGICLALNSTRKLIKSEYIVYLNDDMYVLPNWDVNLFKRVKQLNTKLFMLSSTMIEPFDTGNKCVVVANYGDSITNFDEQSLLNNFAKHYRTDWLGSTWPPNVMHIDLWDWVGGLSIEFSPGMYSDPDLSMKLYKAGVRYFLGIGNSLVYHFGSKSTKIVKQNKGKYTFLLKWGITSNTFVTNILKRGNDTHESIVGEITKKFYVRDVVKRIIACLKDI